MPPKKACSRVTHPFISDSAIRVPPHITEEVGKLLNLGGIQRHVSLVEESQQGIAVCSGTGVSFARVGAKVRLRLEGLDHTLGTRRSTEHVERRDGFGRIINIWFEKGGWGYR